MRLYLALAAASLVGSVAAAQPTALPAPATGSTLIDFSTFAPATIYTNQFAGVTISGGLCANADYGYYKPTEATNFLDFTSASCDGVNAPGSPITFTFASPISTFGFNGILNATGYNFLFATANGSLAQTSLGIPQFYGIQDATPFSSVTVSAVEDGFFLLSDVTYTTAATAVPEPASLALVATGLVLVGAGVRRRTRA